MKWKDHIQSAIHDLEFGQQKDWNTFNKKYLRHKSIKQFRQILFSTVAVFIVGTISIVSYYHFIDNKVTKVPRIQKLITPNSKEILPEKINKNTKNNVDLINNKKNQLTQKEVSKNHKIFKNHQSGLLQQTIQDSSNQLDKSPIKTSDTVSISQKLPSADFSADKTKGCGSLIVQFTPKEISDSIIYLWEFGDGNFSNEKTPIHYYNIGTFVVSLTTKYFTGNKLNQRIKKDLIQVFPKPKANFFYKIISDNELQINNSSTNFEQCQWIIDGIVSNDLNPRFSLESGNHRISLTLNNHECMDSISKIISVFPEIKMYIPTAFTPDGDRQNDEFKPVFSHLPDSYKILIFDQWGKIVFSSTDANNSWNGKIKGQPPRQGLYLWKIVYQYKNNKPVEKTGQVKLIIK